MVEALGIDLKEIIFAIANFLILLAVLAKFMYKPFLANLERRKQMLSVTRRLSISVPTRR